MKFLNKKLICHLAYIVGCYLFDAVFDSNNNDKEIQRKTFDMTGKFILIFAAIQSTKFGGC